MMTRNHVDNHQLRLIRVSLDPAVTVVPLQLERYGYSVSRWPCREILVQIVIDVVLKTISLQSVFVFFHKQRQRRISYLKDKFFWCLSTWKTHKRNATLFYDERNLGHLGLAFKVYTQRHSVVKNNSLNKWRIWKRNFICSRLYLSNILSLNEVWKMNNCWDSFLCLNPFMQWA